jgi:drug/metabolite transporter (DMT)-like permease
MTFSSSSASSSPPTTPTAAFRPVVGLLLLLLLARPRGAVAIGALPGPYPPFDACGELFVTDCTMLDQTIYCGLVTSCTGFLGLFWGIETTT